MNFNYLFEQKMPREKLKGKGKGSLKKLKLIIVKIRNWNCRSNIHRIHYIMNGREWNLYCLL